jgi:hypothetical protein
MFFKQLTYNNELGFRQTSFYGKPDLWEYNTTVCLSCLRLCFPQVTLNQSADFH